MGRKLLIVGTVLSLAAVSPWAILFAVDGAMGTPPRAFRRDACTRACHDHGCRHRPVLTAGLAGDRGLFGLTVLALHVAGDLSGLGPGRGYGAANLLLFCLLWPGLMLALVGLATWQRLELVERRRARR